MNVRVRVSLCSVALSVGVPGIVRAAQGHPPAPHDIWRAWNLDPLVIVPLGVSAWLYATGVRRLRRAAPAASRSVPRWREGSYWTAWIALVLALVWPFDALAPILFSGHMVQHELLMLVAAPLLALSRPLVPILWGLPLRWRRPAVAWSQRPSMKTAWRALTDPLGVWMLHALALWVWHIPAFYEAALADDLVHLLQHACFLGTAALLWWALLHGRLGRLGFGLGVLFVFTTAVHSSLLGALLTFSPAVWYPSYAEPAPGWPLEPLEDQQLGGLLMWVPGGVLYLVSGLALFGAWIAVAERSVRRGEVARARGGDPISR